jgi:hypothetical protein
MLETQDLDSCEIMCTAVTEPQYSLPLFHFSIIPTFHMRFGYRMYFRSNTLVTNPGSGNRASFFSYNVTI